MRPYISQAYHKHPLLMQSSSPHILVVIKGAFGRNKGGGRIRSRGSSAKFYLWFPFEPSAFHDCQAGIISAIGTRKIRHGVISSYKLSYTFASLRKYIFCKGCHVIFLSINQSSGYLEWANLENRVPQSCLPRLYSLRR